MNERFTQFSGEARKLEHMNAIVENAVFLGIDDVQKAKMIAQMDEINLRLKQLEDESGLGENEIEQIYISMTKRDAQMIVDDVLNLLSQGEKETMKNSKEYFPVIKKYFSGKKLVYAAIAVTIIFGGMAYAGDMEQKHVITEQQDLNPIEPAKDLDALIKNFDATQMNQRDDQEIFARFSDDKKEHITTIIIPTVDKVFSDRLGQRPALGEVEYQKDVHDANEAVHVLVLTFDKPKSDESLKEFLVRQAYAGRITENHVDDLHDYFSSKMNDVF